MKQSKLRKRRVWRFAVLYFAMFILFVALIVGPIVAGKYIPTSVSSSIPFELYQPTGQDNNDTRGSTPTGTGAVGGAAATAAATAKRMAMLF